MGVLPYRGGSWRRLEASCRRLEAVLRVVGGVLKRLGAVLARSWGVLSASWGGLGASWGVLGLSWPPESHPTRGQKTLLFLCFVHGFCVRAPLAGDLRSTSPPWLHWCRLGAVSVPSWPILGASLVRLGASWVRLGASWGRLGHQKPPHGRPKYLIFHWFF